jgi:perosamine synthetase
MIKIPLIKPYINDEIRKRVIDVLDSGYLTEGPETKAFESSIQEYVGVRHTLAVCNCTLGLELSLRALGIGRGDEVIVPDYTYPATASVVNIIGADAVLVDVDPETMLMDYTALENAITSRTRAVMPVSLFGNPLDYGRINAIKQKYNIDVVEDAACSLGAEFRERMVGSLADISVFSLHPRKFITTGEGGLVTTDNNSLAVWMESYKHFGMSMDVSRFETEFHSIGTNFKLSNIQAAVGLGQMAQIRSLLRKRRELASVYIRELSGIPGVMLPKVTPGGLHSFQSFCVFVENRNQIMERMRREGVEVQIGTYSLHMHKAFFNNPKCRIVSRMKGSRYAFEHSLTLPLYNDMTSEIQAQVIDQLITAVKDV